MKNRELLEKPFAREQVKQRKGTFGDVLDYIEGATVIQRLNDCFDAEWMFEIVDHRVYDQEVIVLGRLSVAGITKSQFGKSKITRSKADQSQVSIGDDLKAAATDSLKKCATLFGVGLHLYLETPTSEANGNANGNGSRNGSSHANSPASHSDDHGDSNSRLTGKQLSAIFALAKARQWSNKDVRDLTHEMFGKMPDFLTKKEASAVIQHFQGLPQ